MQCLTYRQIIEHLTKVTYIKKLCGMAHDLQDDLFQHIWVRILEMPQEKIVSIYEKGYLEFYINRMIINEIKNPNNSFAKLTLKISPILELTQEEYDKEKDLSIEQTVIIVKSKLETLFWYDKKLFELYLEHGSLRKVAVKTGIKYGAIHKTINKVKTQLRNENSISRH